MATNRNPLHNFNLDTMSGIYPGSRTMTYQRLRLQPRAQSERDWYQLQWYADPAAAVLLRLHDNKLAPEAVFVIPDPQQPDFTLRLHTAISAVDLQADACYACRHWQPVHLRTEDSLPVGRCRWSDPDATMPAALAGQSALSLACGHFHRSDKPPVSELTGSPPPNQPRVRKSAELDPDRLPFWPRLWHRLRRRTQPAPDWTDEIIERSGVGAGTEPCLVCQGRLANLGALAVASPEGDKQTLSVWRCRSCYTTYFNDWTDRWERLESLETEERYYRIAPAEAHAALHIIRSTKGGEHPGRRQDRRAERAQMLALVANNPPLSHQIRQGR